MSDDMVRSQTLKNKMHQFLRICFLFSSAVSHVQSYPKEVIKDLCTIFFKMLIVVICNRKTYSVSDSEINIVSKL